MSQYDSGSITATAAAQGTARAYNGPVQISQIVLSLASVTGATTVTITGYDNNAAASVTTAAGATWAGTVSPGYTGRGPGTSRFVSDDYQSARFGNQQGQSAPNGAGVVQYWPVNTTTGNLTLTSAPTTKTTATISADGTGSFAEINNTDNAGNVVAAVTAARPLFTVNLTAGQSFPFTFESPIGATYGLNLVASASGATAIAANYSMVYDPLP